MRKQIALDLITKKQNELIELNEASSRSLDIVTSTINQLEKVNQKIDVAIIEIDVIKSKLIDTETGLDKTRLNNTKIITKFRNLIED